ncbi:hypothetical protein ACNO5E_08755 [Vibrio parahaemolyticus]|uniref:hypothetical protein n=1 Tax=Vibrio parahaemolyticus TaxID=670 RepID=UPI0008132A2E|nr:hypothetical protein [Vibrio parahaemolyticus]OCP68279.1 hypothetical protein AKH08_15795 [Vibrio parahaemolyticus]
MNSELPSKSSPTLRRKFLASLLGGSIGAVASLASPKSHAFLGFSLEDLLEMFFEKAGSILMMFIANRYYKNFIEAFEEYTESQKESKAKENGLLGGTMQSSMDVSLGFDKEIYQTRLARSTETSPRLCSETEQANVIVQAAKSSNDNVVNITKGQTQLFFDTDFSDIKDYQSSYIALLENNLNDAGQISLKCLSQIFGTAAFRDVAQAQSEFTLMLADIVPSPDPSHLKWTSSTEEHVSENDSVSWLNWPLEGSKSQVKRSLKELSDIAKLNMLIEAISYPMARRVPSRSLTEVLSETLTGAGKNKAKAALESESTYLCATEALMLEVESKSLEPGYVDELNQYADLTPVAYHYNTQLALQAHIRHERQKVAHLHSVVKAISLLIESELRSS